MSKLRFNVDFNKINEDQERMNSGGIFFKQQDIGKNEEVDIRVLPGLDSLQGSFYLKVHSIWMNNKNYISPRTFGEPCPILDAVDREKKLGKNQEILDLIESDLFSAREEYWMQVLVLEPKWKGNVLKEVNVAGNKSKIFKCTYSVLKAMNGFFSHRQYQNGTDLGVFDPEKGYNCIIKKVVKENNTSYTVMMWTSPWEVPEEFLEEEAFLDVYDIVAEQVVSDEKLQEAWDEFIGKDSKKKKKKAVVEDDDEDDEEEEEAPKAKFKPSAKKATVAKVEEEDDDDYEEEEEEEVKPAKKKSLLDRIK
jgi:hypothetical protein